MLPEKKQKFWLKFRLFSEIREGLFNFGSRCSRTLKGWKHRARGMFLNQVMQLGKEGGEYLCSNLINIKSKMVIFEFKGGGLCPGGG